MTSNNPTTTDDLLRALRNFTPKLPRGQIECEWHTDVNEPIICRLEFSPAERGWREDGVQMEPDFDAEAILINAYLRGLDIFCLLSKEQIERIEESALNQHLED